MATFNGAYENACAQQLMGEFFRNSLRCFKGEARDSEGKLCENLRCANTGGGYATNGRMILI